MPIKPNKDYDKLIAAMRLELQEERHHWRVYLWSDRDSMWAATDTDGDGCHLPCDYMVNVDTGELLVPPLMGEIHFVSGKWDEEVVAHECGHGMFHYKETHMLTDAVMDEEEELCYLLGNMTKDVYRWLWKCEHGTDSI